MKDRISAGGDGAGARRFVFFFALAVAGLSAWGFYEFPLISDDLGSCLSVRDSFLYGSPVDWDAYLANIGNIFRYDHFRLPNLLMPAVILMPRIWPALLGGVALLLIFIVGARMGGFAGRRLWATLFIASIVVCFPWVDQLYQICFQLPYLWGSAGGLVIIAEYLKNARRRPAADLFLCLVLGFWMEAFAVAILGAIVATALLFKKFRNGVSLRYAIALAAGILCTLLPVIVTGHFQYWPFLEGRMMLIYLYLLPVVAALALWAVAACRGRREAVSGPALVMLMAVALISAAEALYFKTGPRVAAFGIVCALIAVFMLLGRMFPASDGLWARVAAYVSAAAVTAHLIYVGVLCARLGEETDYVVERYRAGDGLIFAPMTLRSDVAWPALQKPYFDWFAHRSTLVPFRKAYGNIDRYFSVVPEDLRDYSEDRAVAVPGTAGIRLYGKNRMVARNGVHNVQDIDYGYGKKKTLMYYVRFRPEGDSTFYVWLYPDHSSIDAVLNPVPLRIDDGR